MHFYVPVRGAGRRQRLSFQFCYVAFCLTFPLIMASPWRRARRRPPCRIALHADIDGGSAVSSANRPWPSLRRAVDGGAARLALDISVQPIRRDCSATIGCRGLAKAAAVARRAAGRQMNTQYTHALRFLANFL